MKKDERISDDAGSHKQKSSVTHSNHVIRSAWHSVPFPEKVLAFMGLKTLTVGYKKESFTSLTPFSSLSDLFRGEAVDIFCLHKQISWVSYQLCFGRAGICFLSTETAQSNVVSLNDGVGYRYQKR